jgi:hypothetical protein
MPATKPTVEAVCVAWMPAIGSLRPRFASSSPCQWSTFL